MADSAVDSAADWVVVVAKAAVRVAVEGSAADSVVVVGSVAVWVDSGD